MNSNHLPPTELEWANANVEAIRVSGARIVGLKKTIERHDTAYSQTVWLTLVQLKGLAIDLL